MDDLDRWTRVLPLGSGAFGQVHLAWDTADERWVALKRFTGQDELGLLRFVIESRIRVSHPHLVRTLAFRLVDDRAWLVTQLARGGSVRRLMDRAGPLPWGWVVDAVDQVLDALITLHAAGVVHRDLKPANLLLRDAGQVRPHLLVGDFGIATWRTVSMTGVGAAIGTPGYLAPEYLDGHQPSPQTDVFAVGVLAAELLAGRRLVHVSNASPDIQGEWIHSVPLPEGVPARVAAVLARMADPLPSRRYVDCAQAREALLAAAPAGARGDLSIVDVPDLLAGLPPGWTVDGPAAGLRPTGVAEFGAANADAAAAAAEPNAGEPGAPADSTAAYPAPFSAGSWAASSAVLSGNSPADSSAASPAPASSSTASEDAPSATPSANSPAAFSAAPPAPPPAPSPAASSTASSPAPSAAISAASSVAPPVTYSAPPSADSPAASSAASPTAPSAASSAAVPPGSLAAPQVTSSALPPATTSSATPSTSEGASSAAPSPTSAASPAAPPPPSPAAPSATSPAAPSAAFSTAPSANSPAGSPANSPGPSPATSSTASPAAPSTSTRVAPTSTKTAKSKKVRRRGRRAVLLLVAALLLGGAGTLWWAAINRHVAGTAVAGDVLEPGESPSRWTPIPVEPCSRAELGRERDGADGTERCQRSPGTEGDQHWVRQPPGGFPKSDPAGPFPGEACTADGDTGYTPTGDRVACTRGKWQVVT